MAPSVSGAVLLEHSPAPPSGAAATEPARTDAGRQHPLRCRACGRVVTFGSCRAERDGRHVHLRLNPSAAAFLFGCFSLAPGAVVSGPPTEEATWFTGCRWQYAHCAGCAVHLGWFFTGAARFFGLILDRLVDEAG